MIICKKCGHRNTDADQWCTNPGCGAYLAFEGAVHEPAATEQTQPQPSPTAVGPDEETLDRLKAAPPPPPPPSPPPPQANQYQPQPPSASRPPPIAPTVAETGIPPVRPGETVCPNCRWGNDPTRAFCRHCGGSLRGAGGPPPPSGPQSAWSGSRRPRRWPWILGAVLGAIVLLLAGALLARALTNGDPVADSASPSASPSLSDLPEGEEVPRDDIAVRASTSQPDAGPSFLIDGDPDTYWAANPTESNPDPIPRLTFNLKTPDGARVVRMVLETGGRGDEFDSRPRPKDICVRVDAGECIEHELADDRAPQEIRIDAPEPARQVEIEIKSVYPASGGNDDVTAREVILYAE